MQPAWGTRISSLSIAVASDAVDIAMVAND